MLLILMIGMVGSAWGAEVAVTYAGYSGYQKADKSQFADIEEETILRIYESANNQLYTAYENNSWQNIFGGYWTPTSDQWNSEKEWLTHKGCVEITLTSEQASLLKNYSLIFGPTGNQTIYALTKENPAADTFLGSAKSTAKTSSGSKEIEKTAPSASFSLTDDILPGAKYARIYLADASGTALADQSALAVTYDGNTVTQKAGNSNKNGVYVYNAGNAITLSNISATLTGTLGTLANYSIVCLLSTDAGTPTAGPLTKEPDWDLTYTYSFTYPVLEFTETLNIENLLSTDHVYFTDGSENLHDKATAKLKELSGASSISSYTTRWYVRDKSTGVRQPLEIGTSASADKWAIQTGWSGGTSFFVHQSNLCGWSVTNNAAQHGDSSDEWRMFGRSVIYMPTSLGTQMLDCEDYEIVFECTDEYTGGTPTMKLRYIFQFPEIGEFEGVANTGATETNSTQTISDRASSSFALDVTSQASGAKYARFYVTDAQGNAVDPSSLLTVSYNGTAATACTNVNSGFYIYSNGSELTPGQISVTLKAPKAYKAYKVVALYATALTNMTYAGGTMIEEPDYDTKHTYCFDYGITTFSKTPQIEWNATAMMADATDADIDGHWNTSLAELAAGQTIKWWVEDGSSSKQTLAIGTERQSGKWTISLPTGFTTEPNGLEASLSRQTSVTAELLASWVKANVYAPSEATYAEVANHKIVCEIYTNNAGTGNPNARYTFSIHKSFEGSLKSGATTTTQRVLLNTGATTNDISVTLPTGTKYARIYLTDSNGTAETPTGLSATDGTNNSTTILATVDGYEAGGGSKMGYYVYNASGLSTPLTVTFNPGSATLDAHHVVVMTSADEAVLTGSDVTSEPDFDAKTTYWFKYPAASKSVEANVEWSASSMQITAPAIESTDNLGANYLQNNSSHYTMQWYVFDDDGIQNLMAGNNRVNDYWTIHVNGDPFTISNKIASVVNNANLSTNWNNWAAPVFFAPKNKTFRELNEKHTRFVCRFFEDDQSPVDDTNLLSFTYTVSINHEVQLGELKDGGKRGGEKITTVTSTQTSVTLDLTAATTAFAAEFSGAKPTYARVYLAKNDGTMLDPTTGTETLTEVGGTAFTTKEYGYYFQDEANGVTLPSDATLTLPAAKFNYYNVVVCMSKDTGEADHTGAFARTRAITTTYEPDYDYIYTIKFAETSTWPGTEDINYSHSKEVLVATESVTTANLSLADSKAKILTDYLVADWATLRSNFHIRWYIAKKNDEGDYVKIPGSEKYLTATTDGKGHQSEADQGLYWNTVTQTNAWPTSLSENDVLNVTINRNPGGGVPELTGDWEDYKVIAVMTKDLTGQIDDGGSPEKKLTHEPNKLDMRYIFSFFAESSFLFTHDVGASGRAYLTNAGDSRLLATVQQYNWDNAYSLREPVAGDVRQGVHTMEYDLYVDPNSNKPVVMHLPFEKYTSSGNNLEPAAYIRWYDWNTDINNNRLAKEGTNLQDLHETNNGINVSRGFFFLNNDVAGFQPTHDKVGVTFNPKGLTGVVTIACDVSKYYDGIYAGSTGEYMLHEPTLSTRYIFNIRPASVIADAIQAGKDKFEAGGSNMFELAEDIGRVCVSIKGASTQFNVRSTLPTLDSYYFYDTDGTTLVNAKKLTFLPYYVDENNKVWMFNGYFDAKDGNRIKQFSVSSFSGTYISVEDGTTTKSVTVDAGSRIHLVGFLYDDGGTKSAPLVHYELNFVNAPAYEISKQPLERTEAYLAEHMTLQDIVNFDGEGVVSPTIDSQLDNHTNFPMAWENAQYGFCYPDVRRVETASGDYSGISPIHGDYMLLRSMNLNGVSKSDVDYYYKYHWYDGGPTLFDYTKTMGGQHGTFLYVDASDESRTIARMSFSANLCAGSELCFTGVLANMTTGTNPQVMTTVYAVDGAGKRTRVVSFHSGELSGNTIEGTYSNGIWYQIYGRIAIPPTIDLSAVDHFEVDIDNYAKDTQGADYCVDQLMFYTSNAKLKVKQSGVNCGDTEVPMNLYVSAEDIEHMAGKTIYWRICDKDGNAMTDASLYGNGGLLYGQTTVPASVPSTLTEEVSLTTPFSGYFKGTDGKTYFSLANKGFALKEGTDYYISVYNMYEPGTPSYETLWGNPSNTCSVFSPVFVPKVMYLSVEDGSGSAVTTVTANCSTHEATVDLKMVLNMPDDREVSGFHKYTDVHYDYFNGTLLEFQSYELDGVTLQAALRNFRGKQGAYNTTYSDPPGTAYSSTAYATSAALPDAYKTVNGQKYYNVIKQAMDKGMLHLSYSSSIQLSVTTAHPTVTALPIEDQVTYNSKSYGVCSPLSFTFTVNDTGGGPTLVLGFEDVTTYPAGLRVVRVGKEQLDNMQKTDGFLLHVPVNTFKTDDAATAKTGALVFVDKLRLLAYSSSADQTNDGQITANVDVATFAETEVNKTSDKMYIALNFHDTGITKPVFQEGFTYRMFFQVKDKSGGAGACEGNVEFLLKVVPEFVTWNGTSSEWNNDANWQRSTRTELYKGAKGSSTNTATAGHPSGYENNGEGDLTAVATTPKTFVPMKFTYVTMPSGLRAPNLVNLAYDTEMIYNNVGTGATTNIQYDLMVRYSETTCQDHSVSGKVYDCEKFYGNWAKEIYFKPNAELLNQQYLTYEKAWVERELDANKWTLMATPLKYTYAGDMYVPYSATAVDNGRQTSEAFQSISFSTTADAAGFAYSRTKYPIYQHGWTQAGVYVKTKTNDVRKTQYSANIPGSVVAVLDQWSHSYNDVTVPYSTWTAFAIRPHRQSQTARTLIRLPKADTVYDYYQWDNTSPTAGQLRENVTKTTTGKLLTDDGDQTGVTYGTVYGSQVRTANNGTVTVTLANVQSAYGYQLVGNPYMASIDMTKFFTKNNSKLESNNSFWTYESNNVGRALTSGYIHPMQSFFVKANSGATELTFTPDMMVDGTNTAVFNAPRRREVSLTARNDRGCSVAAVSLEKGESVETLFDSNLSDVPMVFTVSADGRAVSLDARPSLELVSFGVSCLASDELVEVSISGADITDGQLYVLDAVTGDVTEVGDGSSVMVQPNDYGRYFLTTRGDLTAVTGIETNGGIVVSVRGSLVTVKAGEALTFVRALTTGGATVYSEADCGPEMNFKLNQSGVYIIEAQTAEARKTVKIVVKN